MNMAAAAVVSPCSLDIMEDELTCPVCLELYCNPAILPCSHSMCRGCISDILNSKLSISRANSAHAGASFECPSCRETTDLTADRVPLLPRNLALENIVRRYLEEKRRSAQVSVLVDQSVHRRGVCLRSKVRRSMSARSTRPQSASVVEFCSSSSNTAAGPGVSHDHTYMNGAGHQLSTAATAATATAAASLTDSAATAAAAAGSVVCDLCDETGERASKQCMGKPAIWYCEHCRVSYCTSCLLKYHPRRGLLALHHIRSPLDVPSPHRKSKERSSCCSDSSCATGGSLSRHTTPATGGASGDDWEAVVLKEFGGGGVTEGMMQCGDHTSEAATMFCDRCKVYVCHLCVCDGEGRHSGHKMLTPDTACSIVKGLSSRTKEQADQLLAELLSDKSKIDSYCKQINELYDVARARVDLQCARLMSDLSAALAQEKQSIVVRLEETRRRVCRQVALRQQEADRCCHQLSELSRSCHAVTTAESNAAVLSQASLVQPLSVKVKRYRKEVGLLHRKYEVITRDKSSKLQLIASTEQLRKRIDKVLSWFIDDGNSGSNSIIPHILAIPVSTTQPTRSSNSDLSVSQQLLPGRQQQPLSGQHAAHQQSLQTLSQRDSSDKPPQPLLGQSSQQALSQQPLPGTSDEQQGVRRVLNKCLTTWGFSSTSFTGESINNNCSWSVTIERNTASGAPSTETSGYLFGVGVSTEVLSSRDSVGMTSKSYGVVVRGGMFAFANAGKYENLLTLNLNTSERRDDGNTACNSQAVTSQSVHNGSTVVGIADVNGSAVTYLSDVSGNTITSGSLPLCLTVGVRTEAPDITVLTYRLGSGPGDGAQKACLVGRRIIRDPTLVQSMYPVFTVSRGVRVIFPTYV